MQMCEARARARATGQVGTRAREEDLQRMRKPPRFSSREATRGREGEREPSRTRTPDGLPFGREMADARMRGCPTPARTRPGASNLSATPNSACLSRYAEDTFIFPGLCCSAALAFQLLLLPRPFHPLSSLRLRIPLAVVLCTAIFCSVSYVAMVPRTLI